MQLRLTIDTFVKVLHNAIDHPMVQKYRSLPKKAGTVIKNILPYPHAIEVLAVAGFVDQGDSLMIEQYNQEKLKFVMDSIKFFAKNLGAVVKEEGVFDPYKEYLSTSSALPRKAEDLTNQAMQKHQGTISAIE